MTSTEKGFCRTWDRTELSIASAIRDTIVDGDNASVEENCRETVMSTEPGTLQNAKSPRLAPRASPPRSGEPLQLPRRHVVFQVGKIDFTVFHAGIADLVPGAVGAASFPTAVVLRFQLAVNTGRRVGQGVQTRDGDLLLAALAHAVVALFEAVEGAFDLAQLARLQLGELGVDFFVASVKGRIGGIAGIERASQMSEFPAEAPAQLVAPSDQRFVQAE